MFSGEYYDHVLATNFEAYIKDEGLLRIKIDEMDLCKTIKRVRFINRNFNVQQQKTRLLCKTFLSSDSDLSVLNEIANNINSSDETLQLMAFQMYRKLGRERNIVNGMIKGDILSRCIELLDSDNICLQSEITSLLILITSKNTFPEPADYIKYEAIPKLTKLLKSTSSIVAEQAVHVLGNIIDLPYARDLAFECDAICLVVDLIKPDTSVTFMDNISWLLSNLCQRNPPLSLELIRPILPVFDRLLNSENEDIISDVCRSLCYLTDGLNDNIQAIMETGILPKILDCLISKIRSICVPAWFTIRNIMIMGDDTQRDAVISAGVFPRLRSLYWFYADRKNIIAKEILWLICKMASNSDQIQNIINAGLLLTLINEILFGRVKVIAIWAVTTMITRATVQQFNQFVNAGILPALCNLFPSNLKFTPLEQTNIINALTGLTKILHAAEEIGLVKKLVIIIKRIGGLDKIEALQHHNNEKIYKKSLIIINTFFSVKLSKEDNQLSKCNIQTEPEFPRLSTEAVVPSFLSVNGTVHKIVQDLTLSSDRALQILAIQVYSKLFNYSKTNSSDILENDTLDRCIELLDNDNFVLQLELISLLTAVTLNTFSKEAQYVIKNGIITKLVKLCKSASFNVVEQAVHALGIIIKDRPYARDLALEQNALSSLVDLIKVDIPKGFMCNIVKTLTYLCKKLDSALPLELIKPVLSILNYLFNNGNQDCVDQKLRSNTCKILCYITYKSNHNIQAVLKTGILEKILECLTSEEKSILIPALQTIKNIVRMDEMDESDVSILADYLPHVCTLLRNHHAKSACFLYENITKEIVLIIFGMIKNNQIQNVIDAGLLPPMIKIFVGEKGMLQKISVWILMYLISRATSQHLTELINADILLAFCSLLETNDYEYIMNGLNGLNNIWDVAEKLKQREKLVTIIKEAGGLDKLKALQYNGNEIVYEKSLVIISSLFS